MDALWWVLESVITAATVVSDPVPAVVGTAYFFKEVGNVTNVVRRYFFIFPFGEEGFEFVYVISLTCKFFALELSYFLS